MAGSLAQVSELHFDLGRPFCRFMQRVSLIRGTDPSVRRRIAAFLLIIWGPLLVFSLFEGHAPGPTPRESLLLDFAAYARFFVAVPLKLLAGALLWMFP